MVLGEIKSTFGTHNVPLCSEQEEFAQYEIFLVFFFFTPMLSARPQLLLESGNRNT